MMIFGDDRFECEKFFKITNIDELKQTKSNSTVLLMQEDLQLQQYLSKNNIAYAVKINSIKSAVYANNLKASYIICDFDLAKDIQKIAENYLFDAKVLAVVCCESEIEKIANNFIDGAIYLENV